MKSDDYAKQTVEDSLRLMLNDMVKVGTMRYLRGRNV